MQEEEKTAQTFSFVKAEHQVLDLWKKEQIFKRSLEQTSDNGPYIFYDGPPFATGLPHHGHLLASTLKDIIPRYFTMRGHHVSRRFGWDCHGLPIEQQIDKKFNMSAMEYTEKYGVKSYNDECRKIVLKFTQEWEKTITRLGRWVDFEHDYKTMDPSFMESVWWVFKQLWEKGLIYKGEKVVPMSPTFGTVLSNFEATSNYHDVQDPSVTVLFKMDQQVDGKPCYLAAWTTTPWTLPSNMALCVGGDIDYIRVLDEEHDLQFYMAKSRLESYQKRHKLKVLEDLKGKDLEGLTYCPLFTYFQDKIDGHNFYKVLSDPFVTTEDGTGIVHLAGAFGEEDNRILRQVGHEEMLCPIDVHGLFTEEIEELKGTYFKDADKFLIKKLKDQHQLYDQDVLVHSYPFCPRSDKPLIYRSIASWYVAVEKIKDNLIKNNDQIHWVPGHIKKGRFGKWLEGAKDWAISRNRVWGTPLPVWHNEKSNNFLCIGSIEELKKYSGTKVDDLHRENVDDLTFSIEGEEGEYKRIPEVLDCWFESGSMPYAQLHYPFENKEVFEKGFPAEFIAEGLDQTRGWFYTLTVLAGALYNKPAFKNVIVNGLILASDGKKMSKRLQNYTMPDVLMEKYGADALRLFLINSGLVKGEELRFSDEGVKDMVRRTLLPWYNSFKFFQTYGEIDGWNPQDHFVKGQNILDQWVLSKLQTLIKKVQSEMDQYQLYNVVPALLEFIEDLTNWYIRLNRRRFWESGSHDDKNQAYSTLYTTVRTITQLMAPFTPFLSEHIFQELKKLGGVTEDSIHLTQYPGVDESAICPALEDAVNRMQQIVLLGRQKRNQEKIKVKVPLSGLTIIHREQSVLQEVAKLEEFIKIELNVKSIHYSTREEEYIKLFARPNSPVLGKRLGKKFGQYRKLIQNLRTSQLEELEAGNELVLEGETFTKDDILIFREALENTHAIGNGLITIDLNCELNDQLIQEGLAREVVNRIQKSRKDLDLNVADRINLQFKADKDIAKAIEAHRAYISEETLAKSIEEKVDLGQSPQIMDYKIDQYQLSILITKA